MDPYDKFDQEEWDWYQMKTFENFINLLEEENEYLLEEEVGKQWVKDQYDNDPDRQ